MVTSPKPARRIPRRARRTAAVITASLLASGSGLSPMVAFADDTNPHPTSTNTALSPDIQQTADIPVKTGTEQLGQSPVTSTAGQRTEAPQPTTTTEQPASTESQPLVEGPDTAANTAEGDVITAQKDGVKVSVTKNVTVGGKIHLTGEGWDSGATITVKIKGYDATTHQETVYTRDPMYTGKTGPDYLPHPANKTPEKSIFWQFSVGDNGKFDEWLVLPLGLKAGQGLKLNVASGLGSGNSERTITTPSLVVGGQEYVEPKNNKAKCVPEVNYPTITVGEVKDNKLHIEGKGYCNENAGAAKVAIKLDEGKVDHVEGHILGENSTIWYIVDQVDDATGNFAVDMPLPDGTNQGDWGTAKPFEAGEHTIRVLSGSLQSGDIQSTNPRPKAPRLTFIYGEYKPSGMTDPVVVSSLNASNSNGLTATKRGDNIIVKVNGGKEGDWVQASAYPDNSVRTWWGDNWYQLNANGEFTLPGNSSIKEGPFKLVVASGNQGKYGELLGWTNFTYKEKSTTSQVPDSSPQHIDKALKDIDSQVKKVDTAFDGMLKSLGLSGAAGAANASKGAAASTTPNDGGNASNNTDSGNSSAKKKTKKKTTKKTTTQAAGKTTSGATTSRATTTGGTRTATGATTRTAGSGTTASGARAITTSNTSNTSGAGSSRSSSGGSGNSGASGSDGAANASSGSSASSKPQPKNTPKPPVKSRDQLTKKNVFGVTGKLKKEVLTMKIPKLKAGDWAYLYVYSADTSQKPVGVSWIQVDSTGAVKLDTKDLPDGEYTVAAVDEKGDLVGWVDVKLGNIKNAAVSDGDDESDDEIVAAQVGVMGAADWWLIGASILIPFVIASIIYAFRRPRRS